MDDIKHGRVYHADSVDDMIKQIVGCCILARELNDNELTHLFLQTGTHSDLFGW